MTTLSTTEEHLEDGLLLHLIGRLDSYSAADLEKSLLDRVASHRAVLLDFSELEFISSAGLRIILMAAKRAKQGDVRLALYGLDENVHKIFEISGFLGILQVFTSQSEAEAYALAAV